MNIIRKTGGRAELDAQWAALNCLSMLLTMSTLDAAGIGNGTTAGRLRTNEEVVYVVGGIRHEKDSTDNLWNLSGEDDTPEGRFRAYWLLLDDAGAASFAAGLDASTADLALASLPVPDGEASVIGVYVAGPETDFTAALAAQGTIYDGIPDGAPCGVPGTRYARPSVTQLVHS